MNFRPAGLRSLLLSGEDRREKIYDFIRQEVDKGRQAYIVYPIIEESEKLDLRNATEMHDHLSRVVFSDLKVGLLHGRMKPSEKDSVMQSFQANEIQILVATTVIEVGVDVPNATVMVIEHAERFDCNYTSLAVEPERRSRVMHSAGSV